MLRRAWRDISAGVDLELWFLLFLAIGVFIYHVVEATLHFEDLATRSGALASAATLLVLAGIAFGLLEDRHARRELQQAVQRLNTRDQRPLSDALVRWTENSAEFRERLSRARSLSLLVRTPHRTVQRYQQQIRQMLELKDAQVRVLAVDPDSEAMRLMCQFDSQCEIMMRVFLEHALPSLIGTTGARDQIQVRIMNAVPSLLLPLIDTDTPEDGVIYATVLSWGQSGDVRPSMRLTRKDGPLFHFFSNEFQALWHAAQPFSPKTTPISVPQNTPVG